MNWYEKSQTANGVSESDIVEARRKKTKDDDWNPNPWAVCNVSVGKKKTKKRERCIRHVKEQQE